MSSTDADMMEAEPSARPPAPPHADGSNSYPNDAVRNLLTMVRQLVNQGKPPQALQVFVMAMKIRGGDEAVAQSLNCARELYMNKIQATSAADELASVFAECAISEIIPSQPEPPQPSKDAHSIEIDAQGNSILAESGRKQIVVDAFSDGSSFVCLQCGGLVSNQRRDEHFTFWCCKI